MFAAEPLLVVKVVPKVQAHLSAFSAPRRSYHALRSGSVTVSSSSCAMIEAIASAPVLPFGELTCSAHAEGHWAAFPTNEYLISAPPIIACVCQPQYELQKPDFVTPFAVRTKYTALESFGSVPLVMAPDTMAWIALSDRLLVPCVASVAYPP